MMDEEKLKNFVEETEKPSQKEDKPKKPVIETPQVQMPWLKSDEQISKANEIGWQTIPIKDLPSMGLFYPSDVKIYIRAATGGEIRHWSSLNEDPNDPNYLSNLDDMLNYIIERCVSIKSESKTNVSWKDIKEIDRFYLLLAIREFTFIKGENKLSVKVSENKKIDVRKEMIDYITFDDRLMKYYSDEERCFLLKFKNGASLKIEIPSVGVTSWLKNYIQRKQQSQQAFDQDFLSFAPFVIRDWRGLNDMSYEKIILDTMSWGIDEISVLNHVKQIFQDTINPVIKYKDESGAELATPLNFQGGIKSILLISDPFGQLV
jgi:hypothetical protein